ncbi:MAG: hypothetical protein P8183_11560 [Anaerolineae bacterium]
MMSGQANSQTAVYERTLLDIVRTLPTARVTQLVDFARFLEAQSLADELARGEANLAEIEAENTRWNSLLAPDESQDLLEKLAGEALEEYRSGQTKAMGFSKKGHIAPE